MTLADVVSKISLGLICPSMHIEAIQHVSINETRPAIVIYIEVFCAQADREHEPFWLSQVYPVPARHLVGDEVVDDRALVAWILERTKDVMVHEVEEFFRYDGAQVVAPKHPMLDPTQAAMSAPPSST